MKKIKVILSWTVSADTTFVKSQVVQVGDTKQSLDATTNTFSFFEEENKSFSASVIATTDKQASPPLSFSGTTPPIADIFVPPAPTNPAVTYEVVDVE